MTGVSEILNRLMTPVYSDGLSGMVDYGDPATIANTVFDQAGDMPNASFLSQIFVSWGQFIDHDLSHTPDNSGELVFSPGLVAPLNRSAFDASTGVDGPREQVNVITASMDASMVYGSTRAQTNMLREGKTAKLKVDEANLMPEAPEGTMAGSTAENPLFLAGDVRANENVGLTTLHTLLVREHNYWADRLAEVRPQWNDHRLFVNTRKVVEYEIQKITYNDWLPHLIGDVMPNKLKFDSSVDTQILTEFSTAAFRFGHTMVKSEISRIEEDGMPSPEGHLTVRDVFFNNDAIKGGGLDDLLRGAAVDMAQESDAIIIDDLNFFLQSPGGMSGFSLAALNILRGRDHGLDTYVNTRAALLGDIDPATLDPSDFSIITPDAAAQAKLASVYASVLDVDLWVGGLAEDAVPGGQLGPTFAHIIKEQFLRTGQGDDTFLELPRGIPRKLRKEIKATELDDIILRNTGISTIQDDVFVAEARGSGSSKSVVTETIVPDMSTLFDFG